MAEWWYDNNTNAPKGLRDITQIVQNIKPLNDAIANMTLAEAVQYIADKRASGDPIAQLVIKYIEHYEDSESDVETYNIGSVNQGGGGRSGGGGAGRVWEDYVDGDGPVSIFGNAKDTEDVIPYLTLISKGGVVSVATQLFIPYSTAIAALLPYMGLEIVDNEFYSQNPNIVKDLVQDIIKFTYKSAGAIINAVADLVTGNVYVPLTIYNSLSEYLSFNPLVEYDGYWYYGKKGPITPANSLLHVFYRGISTYTKTTYVVQDETVAVEVTNTNNEKTYIIFVAKSEYFSTITTAFSRTDSYEIPEYPQVGSFASRGVAPNMYTFNGRTVYYYALSSIRWTQIEGSYPYYIDNNYKVLQVSSDEYSANEICWNAVYGDSYKGMITKGVAKTEPAELWPYPPFVLTNPYTLNLEELVPVNIPEEIPWLTSPNDPDVPSTDEAIAPYLWPQVGQEEFYPFDPNEEPELAYNPEDATAPLPDPNNQATTTPVTDPSIPGGIIPAIDLPEFEPPKSDGESPEIGVPDPIDWPSIVPDDTSETHNGDPGLIHVYNPSNSEMQDFGRWLWVTYNDVTLNKIFNNPFDGVIGAHELYATPASFSVKEKIRSGFLVSDVNAYPVLTRYVNINCGSIVIPEYWGNYLDYAPYTKVHVYLPFIGIVELEADDIIGHSVNITYAVDCYTGACIAQITVAKDNYVNTLYEFQGNCAVEVPLTGGSQAAIKAGLITAAAYGISGVIGTVGNVIGGTLGGAALGVGGMIAGGIIGGLEGLGKTAADAINNVTSLKSSVQHGGTFGSSFGAMGIKKPYIIVKRPIQKVVANYNQDYGYPAHKQVIIGQCTGYLRVLEINVISPTATNDEKAQIEALLKQGVYVS